MTNLVKYEKRVIVISYESFENLDEKKRMNIINAGFTVFSKYGYEKASVDDIVKKAGISKGSLFYYFESKFNFLVYLYEYCGKMMEKIVDCPGPDGAPTYMAYTDFFERLNAIQVIKMKATSEYPQMSDFVKKIIFDTSTVVQEAIVKFNERYTKERAINFFQGLDYHKFKEGIDPSMIIQLLTWCTEGCANQVLMEEQLKPGPKNSTPDFDKVVELYTKYVEMFRKNFYKEEYI